ncbi:hypothetical protein NMY3_02721 [Candidatus Nitrosocosmicus oleophilus]|uniref:Uncharacterized protein n=1 Tax=Candidatus Nitrosocosmicus oleophilus TaxID=1353260 RepID=A0A654M328_9ARCH|nr:hypothetical protein NMY3_02721 [Candidatus Nitrosocosmicus oleophilus]
MSFLIFLNYDRMKQIVILVKQSEICRGLTEAYHLDVLPLNSINYTIIFQLDGLAPVF